MFKPRILTSINNQKSNRSGLLSSLCARHCAKLFIFIISLDPQHSLWDTFDFHFIWAYMTCPRLCRSRGKAAILTLASDPWALLTFSFTTNLYFLDSVRPTPITPSWPLAWEGKEKQWWLYLLRLGQLPWAGLSFAMSSGQRAQLSDSWPLLG